MNSNLQTLYAQKLTVLQTQFLLITQAYTKLTQELKKKNHFIQQLKLENQSLSNQLANSQILIKKLEQMTALSKSDPVKSIVTKQNSISNRQESSPAIESIKQKIKVLKDATPVRSFQKESEKYCPKTEEFKISAELRPEENNYLQLESKFSKSQPFSPKKIKRSNQKGLTEIGNILEDLKEKIRKPLKGTLGRVDTEGTQKEEMLLDQSNRKVEDDKEENKLRMKELEAIWEQRDKEITKMDQLFQNLKERLKEYD